MWIRFQVFEKKRDSRSMLTFNTENIYIYYI